MVDFFEKLPLPGKPKEWKQLMKEREKREIAEFEWRKEKQITARWLYVLIFMSVGVMAIVMVEIFGN